MFQPSKELWCAFTFISWSVMVSASLGWTGFHPDCPTETTRGVFERIQDITSLLHGSLLPTSLCIFNPSVTRLHGDLFLWSARAYKVRDPTLGCVADITVAMPSLSRDARAGSNSLVLAVTRTTWNPDGPLNHTLLGLSQFHVPIEDGRLFKDDDGAVWVISYVPRAGSIAVTSVQVSCAAQASGAVNCDMGLGGTRLLWYTRMHRVEKNWVPINGSTLMSYPRYPAFTPHSIFDWGSYHEPMIKHDFDSVASNETFFVDIQRFYPDLVNFAGSTPAVLHDDGMSYVAVAHVRAHPMCYHDPANSSAGIGRTCEAFAAQPQRPGARFFTFRHTDGKDYVHNSKEYGFVFYRFSASPPYEITHFSFGYIPCAYHHYGVAYPAGLDRVGPRGDFLIAYGESNRYARLLTISAANMDKLLLPIAEMRNFAASYQLCTVPCA